MRWKLRDGHVFKFPGSYTFSSERKTVVVEIDKYGVFETDEDFPFYPFATTKFIDGEGRD